VRFHASSGPDTQPQNPVSTNQPVSLGIFGGGSPHYTEPNMAPLPQAMHDSHVVCAEILDDWWNAYPQLRLQLPVSMALYDGVRADPVSVMVFCCWV
jgi:hypothetical protein